MISKQHRFNHRLAVEDVYKRARTVRRGQLTLKYAHSARSPWRAAVVVSTKVAKSAPVRNRIRRRIYEILRGLEGRIKPGSQMILSVYDKALGDMPAAKLSDAIEALLDEAALISQ